VIGRPGYKSKLKDYCSLLKNDLVCLLFLFDVLSLHLVVIFLLILSKPLIYITDLI